LGATYPEEKPTTTTTTSQLFVRVKWERAAPEDLLAV
jgi:hypothetical protein